MIYFCYRSPFLTCIKLMLVITNFMLCWSLNDEGIALLKFREGVVNDPFGALSSWNEDVGETDHCSWFGIQCVDGHVFSLNLKNLCLKGTLAPELGNLSCIKSIILRNNSFRGSIPEDIGHIEGLELLDLGYNNLSGPLPPGFRYNITIRLDDRSRHSVQQHPRMLNRKLLAFNFPPLPTKPSQLVGPLREHLPDNKASPPTVSPLSAASTSIPHSPSGAIPHSPSGAIPRSPSGGKAILIPIVAAVGGAFFGLVLVIGICFWRRKKVTDAAPWATGLSGQLQKAFVTGTDRSDGFYNGRRSFIEGIPSLRRSELVTACEDFSNIIGYSSLGTIYKGTLSNGIEIAVVSLPVTSDKGWSRSLERQFRKKIETLSKVNHKNFINLIGYCEEKKPFTRMLVFEYAPNGSLFEHLHVIEAEHLDWVMRLRIAMGMAYCLEHMHQLAPPRTHPNLDSSSVNLSEDYAAKISDFCFWNEVAARQVQPFSIGSSSASRESNVYSFGLVLLEMMTGRIPLSLENNSLENWVSGYLMGYQPLQPLIDPMLRSYNIEQLERISGVIRSCLHPDVKQRLAMGDVTAKLRDITGIDRDKASPRLSPLWWAELEVRSVNGH